MGIKHVVLVGLLVFFYSHSYAASSRLPELDPCSDLLIAPVSLRIAINRLIAKLGRLEARSALKKISNDALELDRDAIATYQKDGTTINMYLNKADVPRFRNPEPSFIASIEEYVRRLDRVLLLSKPLPRNSFVFRGAELSKKSVPIAGDTIKLSDSYISTSLSAASASTRLRKSSDDFIPVLYVIRTELNDVSGIPIPPIIIGGEDEILLKRGTLFVVNDVHRIITTETSLLFVDLTAQPRVSIKP